MPEFIYARWHGTVDEPRAYQPAVVRAREELPNEVLGLLRFWDGDIRNDQQAPAVPPTLELYRDLKALGGERPHRGVKFMESTAIRIPRSLNVDPPIPRSCVRWQPQSHGTVILVGYLLHAYPVRSLVISKSQDGRNIVQSTH